MSESSNPYTTPGANLSGANSFAPSDLLVSSRIVEKLLRSRGWVRFIAVMILVGSSLTLLSAISILAYASSLAAGPIAILGVSYLIISFLGFAIGTRLNAHASAITRLSYSGSATDLEFALEKLCAFWKLAGVMLLFFLVCFVALVVVFAVTQPIESRSVRLPKIER